MNKNITKIKYWALYVRLSREDGDKAESLSIVNQKLKLTDYINHMYEQPQYKFYVDDGFSGTTFNRPGFQSLLNDIEQNTITGVIVKDLSRLGRNSPKTSYYVQDFFPMHKIHFIAIDDNINKNFYDFNTCDDMIIDIKNMFNGFYPRDISNKVRSTFRTKQNAGQFIGAFACYGYKKSPDNHNQLIIDSDAAAIVKKIFSLYLSGKGQNTIAKILNKSNIPCPSEYKKLQGLKYRNSNKLNYTTYWTYSSIRNILKNEMYTGCMVQNKSFRMMCSKSSSPLPREKWIIVPDTHEAIIDKNTFNRVQTILNQNIRHIELTQNIHPFAGLLKCGDCGRAMVKTKKNNTTSFVCGSYNRYGNNKCSSHKITEATLLKIITDDFNFILKKIPDFKKLLHNELSLINNYVSDIEINEQIQYKIDKLKQKKIMSLENYNENLLTIEEYSNFTLRCDEQISELQKKLHSSTAEATNKHSSHKSPLTPPVIEEILKNNTITNPDRTIISQMVDTIYIYSDNSIKIMYNFDNN